jgi:hypothetical protein
MINQIVALYSITMLAQVVGDDADKHIKGRKLSLVDTLELKMIAVVTVASVMNR